MPQKKYLQLNQKKRKLNPADYLLDKYLEDFDIVARC